MSRTVRDPAELLLGSQVLHLNDIFRIQSEKPRENCLFAEGPLRPGKGQPLARAALKLSR